MSSFVMLYSVTVCDNVFAFPMPACTSCQNVVCQPRSFCPERRVLSSPRPYSTTTATTRTHRRLLLRDVHAGTTGDWCPVPNWSKWCNLTPNQCNDYVGLQLSAGLCGASRPDEELYARSVHNEGHVYARNSQRHTHALWHRLPGRIYR